MRPGNCRAHYRTSRTIQRLTLYSHRLLNPPDMNKYHRFAEHLKDSVAGVERFSFAEIERIMGEPLPPSARQHPAWWANSRTRDSHSWAHLWLDAGWEKAKLNLSESWVEFRRTDAANFTIESKEAREGYDLDRAILAKGRSRELAEERKRRDDYTCQACGFRLCLRTNYVIEVHHLNPLSASGEVQTTLEDLVSLCPTCHRIAHLRRPPYSVGEIRELRDITR